MTVLTQRGSSNGGTTTTSSSRTVTWDSGVQVGDLIIILHSITHTFTTPSGWTVIDGSPGSAGVCGGAGYYKIATSTEVTTPNITMTFGGSGSGAWSTIVYVAGTFNATTPCVAVATRGANDGGQYKQAWIPQHSTFNPVNAHAADRVLAWGYEGAGALSGFYPKYRDGSGNDIGYVGSGLQGATGVSTVWAFWEDTLSADKTLRYHWTWSGGTSTFNNYFVSMVQVVSIPPPYIFNWTGTSVSTSGIDLSHLRAGWSSTSAQVIDPKPWVGIKMNWRAGSPDPEGWTFNIPRQWQPDPFTGREPWRVVICDRGGIPLGELDEVSIDSDVSWVLNGPGKFDFSMPTMNAKALDIRIPLTEVQLWKGPDLKWWGIITKSRGDHETSRFSAQTLDWYFTRRVVGLVPTPNLLFNGGFEQGEVGWDFGFLPGSIPAAAPYHAISSNPTQIISGGQSLALTGSDAVAVSTFTLSSMVGFTIDSYVLLPAAMTAISGYVGTLAPDAQITCVGYTDNLGSWEHGQWLSDRRAWAVRDYIRTLLPGAQITAFGRSEADPIASNATEAGRSQNRRVEISSVGFQSATGHRQFARQRVTYTNPTTNKKKMLLTAVGWFHVTDYKGDSKDKWGLVIERISQTIPHPDPVWAAAGYKAVLDKNYVNVNAETPRDRWIRMEASVEVPNDDVPYTIEVRLHPPNGTCIYDEITLTDAAQLGYFSIDQSLIVKSLVEHAQDTAMGKSDLNIGTQTPLSGVLRTREYPFSERKKIGDLIDEFPTLADGVDVEVMFTPEWRKVFTFYPRKGMDQGVVLALGSNIAKFSVDYDGEQTSSQIIVQAQGEGSDREEGVHTDVSALEGLILEKVYNATPGSAISSLQAQADRGYRRYSHAYVVPSVTMNANYTDELLDRVHTGDIVTLDIKAGWFQVTGKHRINAISLNPKTNMLTYDITPEDT